MSYIKANTISEYDNKFNQLNVEQLQSVTQYVTNLTHESQSMNLTTNVSLVESQPIYSRSSDFNWTGIDHPSEMNYSHHTTSCCCKSLVLIFLFICIPYSIICIPCYVGIILNDYALRRSQKLKITDTHVDFEYNNWCCFKIKYLISLDDIWFIRREHVKNEHIDMSYFTLHSKDKCVSILGLNSSSNTPKIIIEAIIQRRTRKTQTKPYVIPNITSTLKYRETVSLIPEDACIFYERTIKYFEVAFIDSLGSVDMTFESGSSILRIHPSVDHYRSGSNHYPTKMTLYFEDDDKDKMCSTFKKVVEDSRDSFK